MLTLPPGLTHKNQLKIITAFLKHHRLKRQVEQSYLTLPFIEYSVRCQVKRLPNLVHPVQMFWFHQAGS